MADLYALVPAVSWLLSLLALKLTRTRRVPHVDDLLADPAARLLAGMAVLRKKSALTLTRPAQKPASPTSPSPGGEAEQALRDLLTLRRTPAWKSALS